MVNPSRINRPPLDEGLFFPQLLEFNAHHNPDITYFVYDSPDSDDLVSISYLNFYQACHRAAHEIRPGRAGADDEVVALIAHSDTLLHQTVFMGIVFAGWIVCGYFIHMNNLLTHSSHSPCLLVTQRQQSYI